MTSNSSAGGTDNPILWAKVDPGGMQLFELDNNGGTNVLGTVETGPVRDGPGGSAVLLIGGEVVSSVSIFSGDPGRIISGYYGNLDIGFGSVNGSSSTLTANGDNGVFAYRESGPLGEVVLTGRVFPSSTSIELSPVGIDDFSGRPFGSLRFGSNVRLFANKGNVGAPHLLTWAARGSSGNDDSGTSIQARYLDREAQPVGDQFQVNNHIEADQANPAAARDSQGNLVVVWQSQTSPGDDDSLTSIQARLFDSTGTPRGDQFQVNQKAIGFQFEPDVAMTADGSFFVVWSDQLSGTPDNVFIREYAADGSPVDDELQLNTTSGAQTPKVISDDGDIVVLWQQGFSLAFRGTFRRIFDNSFE